jgi:hypothetical protein
MLLVSLRAKRSNPEPAAVNWRRGLVRFGIGATAWWFLFWTCAYAISPPSENSPASAAPLSWPTEIALAVAAIVDLSWIAAGFWRN